MHTLPLPSTLYTPTGKLCTPPALAELVRAEALDDALDDVLDDALDVLELAVEPQLVDALAVELGHLALDHLAEEARGALLLDQLHHHARHAEAHH